MRLEHKILVTSLASFPAPAQLGTRLRFPLLVGLHT